MVPGRNDKEGWNCCCQKLKGYKKALNIRMKGIIPNIETPLVVLESGANSHTWKHLN